MTDRDSFLAAIKAEPEDDTRRLAYADFLSGLDTVSVECRTCQGFGEFVRTGQQCHVCHGARFFCDETNLAHAELIRLQCALASLSPQCDRTFCDGQLVVCPDCRQWKDLSKRERALLSAHPRLSVTCPACEDESGYRVHCDHCKNSGRAGRFPPERGFVEVCPVLTLASVFELGDETCRNCAGWEGRIPSGCICGGTRRTRTKWQLTPWARESLAAHPLIRHLPVQDRVPEYSSRYGHGWTNNPFLLPSAPAVLPWYVFEKLRNSVAGRSGPDEDWRYYGTPDLANDALAVATCAVARTLAGEVAHV